MMDRYSRNVLAWELSNTLDATFCAKALRRAIAEYGVPNREHRPRQPVHVRRVAERLQASADPLSMDGNGRASTTSSSNGSGARSNTTNLPEELCLQIDAYAKLDTFFRFYNDLRPHRSHAGATPTEVYNAPASLVLDA